MTATSEQLAIDSVTLSDVVCRILDSKRAEVVEWHSTPLTAGMSGLGVYHIAGYARVHENVVPWAVVLKAVERNPDHDDPRGWNFWQREPLLYASGLLDDLPAGLRAVQCWQVEHRSPEVGWLWLEALAPRQADPWSRDTYASVARRLGSFNGAYLTGRPIPSAPWLQSAWLRTHIGWSRPMIERLLACDDHPIVRQMWPASLMPRVAQLWDEREILLSALDRLPRTLCHRDPIRRNLFLQPGEDGHQEMVAIDWAFAGHGAVGEDAAALFAGVLAFIEVTPAELRALDDAVFTAYLGGLRDAGWHGDERLVRLGYSGSVALRDGLCFVGFAFDAVLQSTVETSEAICQAVYHRSATEALALRPQMIAYALQLGEEARQLAQSLQAPGAPGTTVGNTIV